MPTDIKCPNCGHSFPMEEAVAEEYKKDLRDRMQTFIREKEREFQKKAEQQDALFAGKLDEERRRIQAATEQSLRKSITSDFENKLRLLEDANKDSEEKLRASRQKELEFLKKEQDLKNKEAELELSVQRLLQEERTRLSEEIRQLESQKTAAKETEYQLKLKELEKQLEDQKEAGHGNGTPRRRNETQSRTRLHATARRSPGAGPRRIAPHRLPFRRHQRSR